MTERGALNKLSECRRLASSQNIRPEPEKARRIAEQVLLKLVPPAIREAYEQVLRCERRTG